ncbi:MAG: hypothetical protein AMXMBFR13_32890 [Phycisphaerae bacterium]
MQKVWQTAVRTTEPRSLLAAGPHPVKAQTLTAEQILRKLEGAGQRMDHILLFEVHGGSHDAPHRILRIVLDHPSCNLRAYPIRPYGAPVSNLCTPVRNRRHTLRA